MQAGDLDGAVCAADEQGPWFVGAFAEWGGDPGAGFECQDPQALAAGQRDPAAGCRGIGSDPAVEFGH